MILGPLQFDRPVWLLLAPLMWVLIWLIGRRSLSGLSPGTRRSAWALRILVSGMIAVALAEPSIRREGKDVAVLVVMDQSASMPHNVTKAAGEFLLGASERAHPTDRLGIVSTGVEASARVLPSPAQSPSAAIEQSMKAGVLEPAGREATDLADGVRMAMAIKPEDAAGRIVLISDGNETQGSLWSAAERAKAAGIPIDVVPIRRDTEHEVVFRELVTPSTGRKGQRVNAFARIYATAPTSGLLTLFSNDQIIDLAPDDPATSARVDLVAGDNPLTLQVPLAAGGAQRFRAVFEPLDRAEDEDLENNEALSVTFVSGEGAVLVLANDQSVARPLAESLRRAKIDVEVRSGEGAFGSLEELAEFDAVILMDVPASDLTGAQQQELEAFVHDAGGGLVMIGGPNSFGAGGWNGTPVAETMPVVMDVPAKRQIPRGALAIVLDASGSMGMPVGGTGETQQQVAAQAALASVRLLSRLDLVTIVSFDTQARVVVPIRPADDARAIERAILSIGPGGGTYMYAGMRAALRELVSADRSIKHMVLLTDGQTSGDLSEAKRLLAEMGANQVTMSTIAIGDGADTSLLQTLALQSGGTPYVVNWNNQAKDLPQIFMKEARLLQRPLIWEGDSFNPERTGVPSPAMNGMPGTFPPITGYVITGDREGLSSITARAPGEYKDPIVAQWQYGLGRTVAFTSDATSRWDASWMGWQGFDAFWEQHVRWAMRPTGSSNVNVVTSTDGGRAHVVVTALDDKGEALNFARFQARIVGPSSEGEALELTQTGPGRYEGHFEARDPGSYLVTTAYEVAGGGGDTGTGIVQAAVTRPYADEHRVIGDNAGLLRQVAALTGGRVWGGDGTSGGGAGHVGAGGLFDRAGLQMPLSIRAIWPIVALLALGLFVVDVGVRRIRIDVRAAVRGARRAVSRSGRKSEAQVGALRAARQAAERRIGGARDGDHGEGAGGGPAAGVARASAEKAKRQQAKVKFEATAEEARRGGSVVLDDERPGPVVDRKLPAKDPEEEEAGMSRLMRARNRARQGMRDVEKDEE